MLTPSLEDYLEEIYRLSLDPGFIRITDVANRLDVSLPSVNKAVKILSEKGYLDYLPYRNINLTEKGKETGQFLVYRNQIILRFLQAIGSKADKAAEAEAIEHYLSRETIDAMTRVVRFFEENPAIQEKLIAYQKGKGGKDLPGQKEFIR